ncbi:hypothetical protein CHU98_g2568 [Xylaria longipes]|nr:hypothetical protein CHU98_g2568 [Xylaria longipes]
MVGNIKSLRFAAYGIILLTLVFVGIGEVQSGAFANSSNPPVRPFNAWKSFLKRRLNHYETLNITIDASDSDIKRGYRKQVVQWHPDKSQRLSAEKRKEAKVYFDRATEAYEFLLTDRRCQYDRDVMRATKPQLRRCFQWVKEQRKKKQQDEAVEKQWTRQANKKKKEKKATREGNQGPKPDSDSGELKTHVIGSLISFLTTKSKDFFNWLAECYRWFLWRFAH